MQRDRAAHPIRGAASVTRRGFLVAAAVGAAALLVPGVAQAAPLLPSDERRLSFHNLHTEERLTAVYWERGAYVPAALEEIDAILRDHRTGEIRQMAPGLLDLVCAITLRLGCADPVQVISGYRSAATNALLHAEDPVHVAEHSLHLRGEALDLTFESRSLRRLRDAALALNAGGVGYYPRSGFVHVDIGRVRTW